MHYVIIVAVLAIIVFVQIVIFRTCSDNINLLKGAFQDLKMSLRKGKNGEMLIVDPECQKHSEEPQERIKSIDAEIYILTNEPRQNSTPETQARLTELCQERAKVKSGGDTDYEERGNEIREEIVNSINRYLKSNKNSSCDFYLVKDIVDRNSDACEEEIQTLIPLPLYLGLMGTMAGIFVGVGYLVFSGDLNDLLSSTGTGSSGQGITALLAGVALAMVGSMTGLIMTVWSSWQAKNAKAVCERGKHQFLTWIETEMPPVMTTDAGAALRLMTSNLSNFNSTFSKNTESLRKTLATVSTTTEEQMNLIKSLQQIDIKKLAKANIEVYDKLKDCTNEIGTLGNYLRESNTYIEQVNELNRRLADADSRTRLVEQMAAYFQQERSNWSKMDAEVSAAVATSQSHLQKACDELQTATERQIGELCAFSDQQIDKYKELVSKETDTLSARAESLGKLTTELQKMGDVKETIQSIRNTIKTRLEKQTAEMQNLTAAIMMLAEAKSSGGEASAILDRKTRLLQRLFYIIGTVTCVALIILSIFIIIGASEGEV